MRAPKLFLFMAFSFLALAPAASGQMIPHHSPPAPAPVQPSLPTMPPSAPLMPVPVLPQAPVNLDPALAPEKAPEKPIVSNAAAIDALARKIITLKEEIRALESSLSPLNTNFYVSGDGSVAEANDHIGMRDYQIRILNEQLGEMEAQLAGAFGMPKEYIERLKSTIKGIYFMIDKNESEKAYWQSEKAARLMPVEDTRQKITEKKEQLASLMREIEDLQTDPTLSGKLAAGELTLSLEGQGDSSLLGEIDAEAFFDGAGAGLSEKTADVGRNMTLQEMREEDLKEAMSDMRFIEFQTGFLEKVDMTGQVVQTIVGSIPGMTGTDIALSSARGFAEALGEEMAKGTSWDDALKIAAVNAGMKGAVSFVGNKLTGGADGLANRVAILSEVGFSKLTAKQISEMGAKGMTFVVVKAGQTVGQTGVEELAGKPAMKKVADWIKDDTSSTGAGSSAGNFGGGFGTSAATQPLVHY